MGRVYSALSGSIPTAQAVIVPTTPEMFAAGEDGRAESLAKALVWSEHFMRQAIAEYQPTHKRYVMRKGFFGVGKQAHNFAYHILKADPFRATVSREIRKRRRNIRVMLINGARASESENRRVNLQPTRLDKGNLWVNVAHVWTAGDRDLFLSQRGVRINPVAIQLCRSGECMCGTQQSKAEFWEAAILYPAWGDRMKALDEAARRLHGFGWGEPMPKPVDPNQLTFFGDEDEFQPMCGGCNRRALEAAA